jgi:hypothetical protein
MSKVAHFMMGSCSVSAVAHLGASDRESTWSAPATLSPRQCYTNLRFYCDNAIHHNPPTAAISGASLASQYFFGKIGMHLS